MVILQVSNVQRDSVILVSDKARIQNQVFDSKAKVFNHYPVWEQQGNYPGILLPKYNTSKFDLFPFIICSLQS